jgi:hypothetical protein
MDMDCFFTISVPSITFLKLTIITALYLFLPLTAITYYFSRRHRRELEIERVFRVLNIGTAKKPPYMNKEAYKDKYLLLHFFISLVYVSIVSFIGFFILFMSSELHIDQFPNAGIIKNVPFPSEGSRLMCGMAFLGAYTWGLMHLFRRFSVNDIFPAVYYRLSMRMILASVVALVIYNAYDALSGISGTSDSQQGITANIWPVLAFAIGMFPKKGLTWLTERIPLLKYEADRSAPLALIDGLTTHDIMRLEEVGINSCHDLAPHDFVPMVLTTPYPARELADWIMQAKLCVYFGEAVKSLRQQGVRRIDDLKKIKNIDDLALATSATKEGLERAKKWIHNNDHEINKLLDVEKKLGTFSGEEHPQPSTHMD